VGATVVERSAAVYNPKWRVQTFTHIIRNLFFWTILKKKGRYCQLQQTEVVPRSTVLASCYTTCSRPHPLLGCSVTVVSVSVKCISWAFTGLARSLLLVALCQRSSCSFRTCAFP
jgi:hypothetical protein